MDDTANRSCAAVRVAYAALRGTDLDAAVNRENLPPRAAASLRQVAAQMLIEVGTRDLLNLLPLLAPAPVPNADADVRAATLRTRATVRPGVAS